jgi:hypothetical protein
VFRSTYEGQPLDDRQRKLCDDSPFYFSDLTALFVNCTLKPSPEQSHTEGLATIATAILVLMTPIWLGEKSSVCTRVIERL